MHVSLDRNGRVVQSGEGSFRVPMGADEVDNTLSHPISQAENLAHRNRIEYATMAAAADDQELRNQAAYEREAIMENMALDLSEYEGEAVAANNGGENPLIYLAALQSMAGGMTENYHPLSGHMMSADGRDAYHHAMSGSQVGSFGQDVQNLIQQAQSAAQKGTALYQAVTGASGASSPATAPSGVMVTQTPGAGLMGTKIAGVPVPYLLGGLALLMLLRK